MKLFAVNDLQRQVCGKYTVKNLSDGKTVLSGEVETADNSVREIAEIPAEDHAFYLIEWQTDAGDGVNHHACSLGEKWVFEEYMENMKRAGFYQEFSE